MQHVFCIVLTENGVGFTKQPILRRYCWYRKTDMFPKETSLSGVLFKHKMIPVSQTNLFYICIIYTENGTGF